MTCTCFAKRPNNFERYSYHFSIFSALVTIFINFIQQGITSCLFSKIQLVYHRVHCTLFNNYVKALMTSCFNLIDFITNSMLETRSKGNKIRYSDIYLLTSHLHFGCLCAIVTCTDLFVPAHTDSYFVFILESCSLFMFMMLTEL